MKQTMSTRKQNMESVIALRSVVDGDEVEPVRVGGGQRELAFAVVGGRVGEKVVEDGEREPALCDAHQHAHHPPHLKYSHNNTRTSVDVQENEEEEEEEAETPPCARIGSEVPAEPTKVLFGRKTNERSYSVANSIGKKFLYCIILEVLM